MNQSGAPQGSIVQAFQFQDQINNQQVFLSDT